MSPPSHARPRTADEAFERAVLAFRMQRPDEAERLAADVLKSNPGDVRAAWVLGQVLLAQGRSEDAIDPLRRAVRRGQDPAIETLLARALANLGQAGEALDLLRKATARRPGFELAFLELGDQLAKAARVDEAIAVYEGGLAVIPDSAALRMGLGYLHLNRNDRRRARGLFLQVRGAAPERHDARLALANVLLLDGQYAAAADLYRLALDLRPDDPMTRISLGKCLLELGERDQGEAALRAVTRGEAQMAGLAITALAASQHGRFFLRPSAVAKFLQVEAA